MSQSLHEVAKVLEFQLQHHYLQRNPRADLLQNGLVGSPYVLVREAPPAWPAGANPGQTLSGAPTTRRRRRRELKLRFPESCVRRPTSGVRGRHGGVRGARFSGKHAGAPDGGGGGRNENI